MENIYEDIAARTGGNIYIGVVGPVRTGKREGSSGCAGKRRGQKFPQQQR